MVKREIVGIILAGGQSRRMGKDKAFLEVSGIPLIERVLRALSSIFPTVAVVSKHPEKFHHLSGVHLIQDLFPEQHALGGVCSALSAFPGKDCFVFACDLPFLNPSLIQSMAHQIDGHDLLVPKSRRGLEPLHALYTETCRRVMERHICQKRWSLEGFIHQVDFAVVDPVLLHSLDPKGLSFFNVNTPKQLQRAQLLQRIKTS